MITWKQNSSVCLEIRTWDRVLDRVSTACKESILDGMRWICTSVVVRSLMTGGSRGMASWKICSSSDSTRFSTSPPSVSTSLHSKHRSHNFRTHLQLQVTVGNKMSQSTAAVRLLYIMQQHLLASKSEIKISNTCFTCKSKARRCWRKKKQLQATTGKVFSALLQSSKKKFQQSCLSL